MKVKYEVVEFRLIERANLKKHPAAELPMGDDDKGALKSSIDERGIIQPLLVLEKPDELDGMFLVVDGCNRMESVAADAELPCVLIRTDDPRAVALECLGTGRQRSTGQRILAFLLMNKKEVLKAAELGDEVAKGGRNPHVAVSRETARISGVLANFTTDSIAERLKVCKEDVIRAVELFRCVMEKKMPAVGLGNSRWNAPLDPSDPDDVRVLENVEKTFSDVMAGGTAIRNWKRSFGGRQPTTGPKGRPDINHADLVRRGLHHLRTVFKADAWHFIKAAERDTLSELFDEVVGMLPDELMVRLPRK